MYMLHRSIVANGVKMHMCVWHIFFWFETILITKYPFLVTIGVCRSRVYIATVFNYNFAIPNISPLVEM